jgi:hypothetical protein
VIATIYLFATDFVKRFAWSGFGDRAVSTIRLP